MITVLGSINMDLIAKVDRLPKSGETVGGHEFTTAAGGKGANQALAAGRAGATVHMCGAVGNDTFAAPSLAYLESAGVSLARARSVDGATGTALIMVDTHGENIIAVVPGANGAIGDSDAIAAVDAMNGGDYLLLQLEIPAIAIEAALRAARTKGIISVLNIAPLTDDAKALAQQADIVIANETEFELLAGKPDLGAAQREKILMELHQVSGQTIIVTLGAEGAIAAHEGTLHRVRGLDIKPVDTVGAGDTFCGYLAAGLDKGAEFSSALRQAAVAGSLACLKPGAQPAIPLAQDVAAAL
ncbi:MAG: ribokinase [Rhizobiaceae bacterium]|nr:ribokinase [Rhizobiaceae bacterium]